MTYSVRIRGTVDRSATNSAIGENRAGDLTRNRTTRQLQIPQKCSPRFVAIQGN
jgi:hypothetical protein